MDINEDIETTFPLIDYQNYWKRATYEHFRTANVLMHGDNWKQCYAENFIKEKLINFQQQDDLNDLLRLFSLMKNYIFNLHIPYFSANFDISLIPQYFLNVAKLDLKYSPKLIETRKEKIPLFKKKITRKLVFDKLQQLRESI